MRLVRKFLLCQQRVLNEELEYYYVEQDEVRVSVFSNVVFMFIPILKDK